jgi:hypothetical protein
LGTFERWDVGLSGFSFTWNRFDTLVVAGLVPILLALIIWPASVWAVRRRRGRERLRLAQEQIQP